MGEASSSDGCRYVSYASLSLSDSEAEDQSVSDSEEQSVVGDSEDQSDSSVDLLRPTPPMSESDDTDDSADTIVITPRRKARFLREGIFN